MWPVWLISACELEIWVLGKNRLTIPFNLTTSPSLLCGIQSWRNGSHHAQYVTKVLWVPDVQVTAVRESHIALGCCVWSPVNQRKSLPVKATLLMASGWGADIYSNQCNRTLFLVKCRPELLSPSPSGWNRGGINRGLRDPPVFRQLLQSKVCSSCAVTHPLTLLRWQDVSGLTVWPHWGQVDRGMWYGYVKPPAHEQPPSVLTAEVPGTGRVGMI